MTNPGKRLLNPVFGLLLGALALALHLSACKQNRRVQRITVRGSDTEVNLVLLLAEAYMAQDPNVSLSIAGGGSGVGIAALMNGKTDIANSSREVSPAEMAFARQRGVHIVPTAFAYDALVVVTNPEVGVDSLTLTQLGGIFAGSIRDWREVGGTPGKISLYGRQSNSGTFLYFREKVVGRDFSSALKQMNGTAQIVEAIKKDAGAIGYVGLGYAADSDGALREGLRVVRLKADVGDAAVSPLDQAALRQKRYPLLRPLYQLTNEAPTGKILEFFQFEAGPVGQRIIAENGYLPVGIETSASGSMKHQPDTLPPTAHQ